MIRFNVEHRYRHITINYGDWKYIDEINDWCYNADNGDFEVFVTGIRYKTDKDLSAFILKWS